MRTEYGHRRGGGRYRGSGSIRCGNAHGKPNSVAHSHGYGYGYGYGDTEVFSGTALAIIQS